MLNEFRSRKIGVAGYRFSAFNDYIDGYLSWMVADGYSKSTLHGYLGHIRAFAAFLKRKRIKPADLNDHHVPEFLKWYKLFYRGPFPRRVRHSRRMEKTQAAAVRSLLTYLQESGFARRSGVYESVPPVVQRYVEYLTMHRGLSEVTVSRYRKRAIRFHEIGRAHV